MILDKFRDQFQSFRSILMVLCIFIDRHQNIFTVFDACKCKEENSKSECSRTREKCEMAYNCCVLENDGNKVANGISPVEREPKVIIFRRGKQCITLFLSCVEIPDFFFDLPAKQWQLKRYVSYISFEVHDIADDCFWQSDTHGCKYRYYKKSNTRQIFH